MSATLITDFVPESSDSTGVIKRYQDAYRRAEATVTFGESVRLGGILLGGAAVVGSLVELLLNPAERYGFPVVFAWLIAGVVLLVLISQILGKAVQGQGELLKAALDSGVNSSPFLSNAQRAKLMSLKPQPTVPERITARAA